MGGVYYDVTVRIEGGPSFEWQFRATCRDEATLLAARWARLEGWYEVGEVRLLVRQTCHPVASWAA
jgi:hypothetical protein